MAVIQLVQTLFEVYSFILLARVLTSWVQIDPYNPIVRILYQLTEPLLGAIRRFLPQTGMMDFSPIVAFVLITIVERIVVSMMVSALR
ncbi:MAG: YggT family protein [Thermoflexales bacterium]|nr:YggT family protein [Thermoflexales bacterium]